MTMNVSNASCEAVLYELSIKPQTWEELQDRTGMNDDRLGRVISELLIMQRLIKTKRIGEKRIYWRASIPVQIDLC